MKNTDIDWIRKVFHSYSYLPINIGEIFCDLGRWVDLPEKTKIVIPNQISDHFWIIKRGSTRNYLTTYTGKNIVVWIHRENEISGDLKGLMYNEKSRFTTETIKEVLALEVCFSDFLNKYQHEVWWIHLRCQIFERLYFQKEYHSFLLHLHSPEKRVEILMKDKPWMFVQIQDQYLSSYLGMTPVSFSRIKKRLRKRILVPTSKRE